jgi:hypothetical protein
MFFNPSKTWNDKTGLGREGSECHCHFMARIFLGLKIPRQRQVVLVKTILREGKLLGSEKTKFKFL